MAPAVTPLPQPMTSASLASGLSRRGSWPRRICVRMSVPVEASDLPLTRKESSPPSNASTDTVASRSSW